MSLDGFIADTNDQVGPLFDWYGNGEAEVTGSDPGLVFHTSAASAAYLRAAWSTIGADVVGRRLFDLANGWDGCPAVGEAVFVVTIRHRMTGRIRTHRSRSSRTDCPAAAPRRKLLRAMFAC
jgi:hypothetical protein